MWTKLGDEFPDDAADLSDAAFRTHVEALAWSNRRLLDLRVPKRDLRRFAFSEAAEEAVQELVRVGWWEDDGEAWKLAHSPEWQQTREQVEHRRKKNTEAQQRVRRHKLGDHSLCRPASSCVSSRGDIPADSEGEWGGDSGRGGAGRNGSERLVREAPVTPSGRYSGRAYEPQDTNLPYELDDRPALYGADM